MSVVRHVMHVLQHVIVRPEHWQRLPVLEVSFPELFWACLRPQSWPTGGVNQRRWEFCSHRLKGIGGRLPGPENLESKFLRTGRLISG